VKGSVRSGWPLSGQYQGRIGDGMLVSARTAP